MRSVFTLALLVASAASDVVPHCGGPEVSIVAPGGDCGAHGSRWRGDCRAPGQCLRLVSGGHTCSLACKEDTECTQLGQGFVCAGRVSDYATNDATKACIRGVAAAPTPRGESTP